MKVIKNNIYLLKMIYASDKKRIFFLVLLSLNATVSKVIYVLFMKLALDCITVYQSFRYLLLLVLAQAAISTLSMYFSSLFRREKFPISENIIKKHILKELYGKSLKIELSQLDNPVFYDKFNRAINEAEQRPFEMLLTIENFLSSMLTIFSILAMIILLDWELAFLALLSASFSVLANMATSKIGFKKNNALTRPERKIGYVRRLFYLPQYIEEMKTNYYNDLLYAKLDSGTAEYNVQIQEHQPKIAFFDIVRYWQILVIHFGMASFFMGRRIVNGAMGVTSFVSLIFASATLSEYLSGLFAIIPQMAQHSLFIDNLREILDYKSSMEPTEESKAVQRGKGHAITLEQVSFKYNASKNDVIKNVSLKIAKGEKIALVGENGAGKSTLVKLILRLYDPQGGELYFDEDRYKSLNVDSLRNEIAVVYQDFQSYAFSIGENVLAKKLEGKEDEQGVWDALKGSGLSDKIESLPDKLQTPLTNEFEENGTNFSGGENQKLAIAKAIHKDAGVIIMDEPSSSLDPLSEHEMYLRMFEMCKDKTLILISHQLYCTKMVDKIYYMENGAILESGSHEELMKLNGQYASLYNIQAEQYR